MTDTEQLIPHDEILIDAGGGETFFDDENALAILLHANELMCNDGKFDEDRTVCLFVLCNDVFAWGCADAEPVTMSEIADLYEHWRKDARWGTAVWCIKRRGQMPQKPVEDDIRNGGIWDLDSLDVEPNTMDAEVTAHHKALLKERV